MKSLMIFVFLTMAIGLLNIACEAPQRMPEPVQAQPEPAPMIAKSDPVVEDQPSAAEPDATQLAPVQSNHAQPQSIEQPEPSEADRIAADIEGYLSDIADRTAAMDSYTLRFTRYERKRSGFSYKISGPEIIQAWFRRDPFSVKLKWLNEDLKYDESVYVAGEHDSMVRFVTRFPVFLLKPPPQINLIDTQTPVIIGETKRPITEFGLEGMLRRTLGSLETDGEAATSSYEGVVDHPETGQPSHKIRLTYSRPRSEPSIQDLYIDAATQMPTGSELRYADGTLDGAYYYAEIDADVSLSDTDFLLSVELEDAPQAAGDAMAHE